MIPAFLPEKRFQIALDICLGLFAIVRQYMAYKSLYGG